MFFTVLADVLGLAIIMFWMFRLDWVLALATWAVLPFLFAVLWIWQERAKKAFIKVRQAIAIVNTNLQENISGVRVIQSLNREDENLRRFDEVNASQREQYVRVLNLGARVLQEDGLGDNIGDASQRPTPRPLLCALWHWCGNCLREQVAQTRTIP